MELGPIGSLDLTRSCPSSSALGEVAFRLLAYLTWPSDAARRNQFMATMGAKALGEMKRNQPSDYSELPLGNISAAQWEALRVRAMEAMAERWFHPFGGYAAVADAPGIEVLFAEIGASARSWQATGQLLWTIRSIEAFHPEVRGGASINKAIDVMERLVEGKEAIGDRTGIMETWARYKPVAHLCAAFTEAAAIAIKFGGDVRKEIESGGIFFSGLGRTLAVASDYCHFMTSYQPHGRKVALVAREEVWAVPTGVKLKEVPASIAALPAEGLHVLTAYRAPKRR